MDKSQLIEKIAGHFGVEDTEQKLFFETFLRKCSETLDAGESVQLGEIGKVEYRQAQNKEYTDMIAVITDEDEFLFDIPGEEKEIQSIDSYFSISIGKPVIPLRENDDSEFFIPHSGNEMKRMFELKVSRFIEDSKMQEPQTEIEESDLDFSDNIPGVNFSFKDWKSSSDTEKGLNDDKIEEEKTENDLSEIQTEEDYIVEETNVENDIEEQTVEDLAENISDEIPEETESQIEEVNPEIEDIPHAVEEIKEELQVEENKTNVDNELDSEVEQIESSESIEEELFDEQVEETEKELENSDETFNEEKYFGTEPVSEEEKNIDNDTVVTDSVNNAQAEDTSLENNRKKSYGGFIFAIVVLVIIGVVIFFSYYLTNTNKTIVQKSETPKQFAVTIERTHDIPVTYPYSKGMLGEPYNAININILGKPKEEEIVPTPNNDEIVSSGSDNSGNIEIRKPLPARRVKGYIYKYENMYAVQVSSWKTKSIAVSETKRYLDAGYNTFIEQTELSDKGIYYRVRVGGFSSLEEAENFLKK